jgi:hypothetical protein
MSKDKHLERIKAIKRVSRIETGGPHGKAGVHADKRMRRTRRMGTTDWLEEAEEDAAITEEVEMAVHNSKLNAAEQKFPWSVRLYYWDEEDERHLLREGVLRADTKRDARQMAMDEWWDPRLDAAGCSADIEVEASEEE